jgi:hypothetical protein
MGNAKRILAGSVLALAAGGIMAGPTIAAVANGPAVLRQGNGHAVLASATPYRGGPATQRGGPATTSPIPQQAALPGAVLDDVSA